ncbi:MAG: gliding motility protein GldM [Bacteroidota bacterium]|nr:gliding motility protein GldM [Bacteroidota bacterium]
MASAKDTPRQKMIGMMYLVLTALLALNVSKDILDAFIVVNKGLENTNNNFTGRNEQLYAEFDLAKSVDPVRVTSNWKLAQEVKKHSAELSAYIDQLQKQLVKETEGIEQSVADTLQMANIESKDNYDTPTNILIGDSEDGSAGASRVLKNKLNDYKSKLTNAIQPSDRKKVLVDIDTEDPTYSEENENWELYNFYHRPLVASITILSKLKNDVKNAEATIVDYLLQQVDIGNLKFDTVAAKVIPQSNYVLLGEEYKADVFLAAFNKTRNPEIMIGNYNEATKAFEGTPNSVRVENGLGKYSASASKEGIMNYSGTIKMVTPQGKEVLFPFKSEYIVARPSLTVSADNMNVVYIGLDNPVSVSVPGVPNEKLSVSINNGRITPTGNGKFNVVVNSGTKADVSVMAEMENGEKRSMGTMSFRVKSIPNPTAKVGRITSSGVMNKSELNNQMGIVAEYNGFAFSIIGKVSQFNLEYTINGAAGSLHSNNNMFTEDMKKIFKQLKKNDKISFEYIKGIGPDKKEVQLSPLNIRIN